VVWRTAVPPPQTARTGRGRPQLAYNRTPRPWSATRPSGRPARRAKGARLQRRPARRQSRGRHSGNERRPSAGRGGDLVKIARKLARKLARALAPRLLPTSENCSTSTRIPYATSERRNEAKDGCQGDRQPLVMQTSAYMHNLQDVPALGATAVQRGRLVARPPSMCICSCTCLPHHSLSGRLLSGI